MYKPGDVIDDRYEIVRPIGEGGHGAVYQAKDQDLDSMVAIKVLHTDIVLQDAGFKTRLQREARAMGQLAGTSAVQVLAFNRTPGGGLYLVMEYLEGRDLGAYLAPFEAAGGHPPSHELVDILSPIAHTLEEAHRRKIVHRDLKLANIFVLERPDRGRVRLLDFGLVKDMKMPGLTMPGTVAGSPAYISPESWLGKPELIDHRVDVYSFGVVIFRALAGELPFDPNRPVIELISAVTRDPRPSLAVTRPDLPPAVDEWAAKVLAISPKERFQSVREMWSAIEWLL